MANQDQARISKFGWFPRILNAALPRVSPYKEMGVSGTPVYAGYVLTPEKSPKLVGQEKYRSYSEMLANVSIIAAGVRYFLNIVAKPSWSAEAPEDSGDEGEQYADFVNDVLLEDLNTPWSRVVRRCGTYRFHGFNIQEWTAKKREDGKIGFEDIESRPQWTIWRWEVDERGTVIGCWQRDPVTGKELGLPRGKLMYIVDDTLTDSPEGMGLLRHCYEPAKRLEEFFKQEGYGYLRDLQGIPIGRAPIDDLQQAVAGGKITQAQMNQNLDLLTKFVSLERKDKDTGLVLNSQPYVDVNEGGYNYTGTPKWGLELLSGSAPGLVPINQAIVRVTTEIARILGVEHLLLGADAEGSYALAKEKARDLYLLANSVLYDIREQAQHDLLWPLWDLNGFPPELMPELKTEDVTPKDVEQISRVLRDMATAGAPLQPDDEVQNSVRDLLGMPHIDLEKVAQQMQQMASLQAQSMGVGQGSGANPYEADLAHMGQQQPTQEQAQVPPEDDEEDAKGKKPVPPFAKKGANGHSVYADDLYKAWEEGKHRRAPKGSDTGGQFTSGGGGGESAEEDKADDGGKQFKQRTRTKKKINDTLDEESETIYDSVKEYLVDNSLSLGVETAVSFGVYRMLGTFLGAAMAGPAGMVIGNVAAGAASQMVEALKAKTGLDDRHVWGLLRDTVSNVYDNLSSKFGKAEPAVEEEPAEGDTEEDDSNLQSQILQALEALLQQLEQGMPEGEDDGEGDEEDDTEEEVKKFDPNQPRDEYGRWSETGAEGRRAGRRTNGSSGSSASDEQKSRVQRVLDKAKGAWGDARAVLGSLWENHPELVSAVLSLLLFGASLFVGGRRLRRRAQARAEAKAWNEKREREAEENWRRYRERQEEFHRESERMWREAYEKFGQNRHRYQQGKARPSSSAEDPLVAAARMHHGAKAAAIMALYLRPGTPGEKAAALAALKRMGIDPTTGGKMSKAVKKEFSDALDHLLTEAEAEKILNALMENLTSEQADAILQNAKDLERGKPVKKGSLNVEPGTIEADSPRP